MKETGQSKSRVFACFSAARTHSTVRGVSQVPVPQVRAGPGGGRGGGCRLGRRRQLQPQFKAQGARPPSSPECPAAKSARRLFCSLDRASGERGRGEGTRGWGRGAAGGGRREEGGAGSAWRVRSAHLGRG